MLIVMSDSLCVPPRAGDHIHLLGLARAVAAHVPTRVFAWADGDNEVTSAQVAAWSAPSVDGQSSLITLDREGVPGGSLARTRHYVREAWQWIETHAPPGSLVWVRRHSTAFVLLTRLIGRRRRHRLLYDASSFLRLEAACGARGRLDHLKGIIEERIWSRFDLVRTLCDPMRDYVIERGVDGRRVVVVPVGTDAVERTWQGSDEPHRLLYVGSASPWQGLDALLEAMRLLAQRGSSARLTIVGLGPDSAQAAQASDNVVFHGRLPHAEASSMSLTHDLFVLPRPRVELTDLVVPMKIVEAMACGVPILSTDLRAVRWVTGDDGALFTPDGEAASIADGIEQALARPDLLARTSQIARQRVERFAWSTIGASIANDLVR